MFPLLLIPLAIVNIIVFLMPGVSLSAPVYTVTLPSLATWTFTFSDGLLAFSLLLLMLEMGKAARPGAKYFTDHFLSLLIFCGAAAEFLMLPQFANSPFLLLTLITFVDLVAGIVVRARRPKAALAQRYEPVTPAPAEQINVGADTRPAPAPAPMPAPVATPAAPASAAPATPTAPVAPAVAADPVIEPASGPVVVRPASDIEVIPPRNLTPVPAATDEPTVIPQR